VQVDALGASDAVLRPHIPGMLEVCLAGYTTNDSPDIRDHSHTMFANIAKALGAEFEPWIPRVLPLAIASCRAEDGRAADQQGNAEQGSGQHMRGSPDKEQLDGSSDDDDDDDSDDDDFNVRTGASYVFLPFGACTPQLCAVAALL
jgi:importin-4